MLGALMVMLMLTAADSDVAQALSQEEQDEVLRHLYFRAPQSDIVRDGMGGMLLDPLPFTWQLPAGVPEFDRWEGRGYSQALNIPDPEHDDVGKQAIKAGICEEHERPCAFSFVYLFAVTRSYIGPRDEQVAIRYLFMKRGERVQEGVIWGTDEMARHLMKTARGWRAVTNVTDQKQMNKAVELANSLHQARLHELEVIGRIVRKD